MCNRNYPNPCTFSEPSTSLAKKSKKFASQLSLGGKKKSGGGGIGRTASVSSIASGSFIGMDISEADRTRFSDTMREVLSEMEPVCQEEQNFITNFFHLTG